MALLTLSARSVPLPGNPGAHPTSRGAASAQGELPAEDAVPGPALGVGQRCVDGQRRVQPLGEGQGGASHSLGCASRSRSHTGTSRPCARNDPT